jgi:hypothetical protein
MRRQGVKTMSITLSSRKKGWLLYLSRAAAFYQAEYWWALWDMERLVAEASRGGKWNVEWDVVGRFFQLERRFAGKSLGPSDLEDL